MTAPEQDAPLYEETVRHTVLPVWAERIETLLNTVLKELARMATDQENLDSRVQQLGDVLTSIEAEIAALKNQPAAAALDFSALDALIARGQGDEPANPPAPAA